MKENRALRNGSFWDYFVSLSGIPRVTYNEAAVREWIISLAEKWAYYYKVDSFGNLLVKVPAYESQNSKVYALQAHLDMVGEKSSQSVHDFTRDIIDLVWYTDISDGQEWLKARDTTLGADNGIGVSYILELIDPKKNNAHAALECIFTVEEETGLCGAQNLGFADEIHAQYLINLDNSVEGEVCIGCAGGCDLIVSPIPDMVQKEADLASRSRGEVFAARLAMNVSGLRGGHSGFDIYDGRENAHNMILLAINSIRARFSLLVLDMSGGDKLNAIPRESQLQAVLTVQKNDMRHPDGSSDASLFLAELRSCLDTLRANYYAAKHKVDDGIVFEYTVESLDDDEYGSIAANPDLQKWNTLVDAMNLLPRGILKKKGPESVDLRVTINLARVEKQRHQSSNFDQNISHADGNQVLAYYNLRTMDPISLLAHIRNFETSSAQLKLQVRRDNYHIPWYTPLSDADGVAEANASPAHTSLADRIVLIYKELYEKSARDQDKGPVLLPWVSEVHAAVECGVILSQCPTIREAVSLGPQIEHMHSPDEKVNLASADRCYLLIKQIVL